MSHTVSSHQRSEKLRIYRAIPQGSARARSQAAWLRALDDVADYATLRADAAINIRAIVWVISSHAHWHTLVSIPGWGTIADRTGLSESTINRAIRRLRAWGLLGIVATGSTWRTRGGRPDDDQGNLGAEYVLCVPADEPVEISDRPSLLRQEERNKPHVRARENRQENPHLPVAASSCQIGRTAPTAPWSMHQPPETRGQRLAATRRLQQRAPVLNRLSARQLRSVLRPWYELGRTPAQVLYALDHRPDGTPHWHTTDVRHVAGWIRSRLGQWDGHTPPALLGSGQATDLTAADVAQLPRADAAPVADTETHAARARRMLAVTQRRSDKKPARGLGVSLLGRDGQAPATVSEATISKSETVRPADGNWLLRNAAARARTTSDMPGRVVA